jgi:hypothetical protein
MRLTMALAGSLTWVLCFVACVAVVAVVASGCTAQPVAGKPDKPLAVHAQSDARLVKLQVQPYPGYEAALTQGLDRTSPVGFVATGIYDDGSTQDITTTVTWSSTDLDVVSFGGTVTAPFVFEWIWGASPGSASLVATAPLPSETIGLSDVVRLSVN